MLGAKEKKKISCYLLLTRISPEADNETATLAQHHDFLDVCQITPSRLTTLCDLHKPLISITLINLVQLHEGAYEVVVFNNNNNKLKASVLDIRDICA
jgi:hypothetical protein